MNFFMCIVHPLLECEQWKGQILRNGFIELIIGQIILLALENSESVPVWTIVLPAWILNVPFQLIFFFTMEIHC